MSEDSYSSIIIIGGGVIGLSAAFYCAQAGIEVTLIEQSDLGSGTSAQTARVVRGYFPRRVADSELAVGSLAEYRGFAAETGVDPELEQTGFLVVLTRGEDVETLGRELDAQRAVGVEAELITAAQVCQRNPFLDPADIVAAVWSPQAFSCNPQAIMHGYAETAQRRGVRLLTGMEVIGVDAVRGRVATTNGDYVADAIVCAAGPWSGRVAAMTGVSLPVTPQPSELMTTGPIATDMTLPFTLHLSSALRVRRLGDALLIGLEGIPKGGDQRALWHRAVAEELTKRYARLRDVELHTAWTGSLDVAPQRTAFIGQGSGSHRRFLYAAGFSGRGLCQAPMAGQIIRDLCLGQQPAVDLKAFSPIRLDAEPHPAAKRLPT
ncbi:NAD(P)/FAD-dependent oxidoreductase [Saccharopolyspora elongata]|uniref:FAD-binding oxidoreductase n=1 Tax=Saccharopolyspora elongata TaxID=2530387 RepID=A0A4R4Y545_9PSEU|nr:FAD-dependent oxidoreductase [Saccharopolyspora elongata]TDD39316.1 FAD-binding oxidoreductase [Saccharopolyspora elongata]